MPQLFSFFDRILMACAWIAGGIFFGSAVLISVNVVTRNLIGAPINGLLDAVQYGLLVATFLGAPWVLSRSAHVAVDLVTGALPGAVAVPLARAMALLGAAVCAVVVWYALEAAMASFSKGSMIRSAFAIPEWWTLALMPVAFALMTLEFLRQAIVPPVRPSVASGL